MLFKEYKRIKIMIAFMILGQSIILSCQHTPNNRMHIRSSAIEEDATSMTTNTGRNNNVKRFDRLTIPLGGGSILIQNPFHHGFGYNEPTWQVGSKLVGAEAESMIDGMITFQQLYYSPGIKVNLSVSGLPAGKHALHIHTFGDISDECKSTGGQFPNNFIGNAEAKDDGSISTTFISPYLSLFGFNGIVGRSLVIHEKPIDLNTALNAEVISPFIPDLIAYRNEEKSVGTAIACGIISVMSTNQTPEK